MAVLAKYEELQAKSYSAMRWVSNYFSQTMLASRSRMSAFHPD
jgi:hypothetical protein